MVVVASLFKVQTRFGIGHHRQHHHLIVNHRNTTKQAMADAYKRRAEEEEAWRDKACLECVHTCPSVVCVLERYILTCCMDIHACTHAFVHRQQMPRPVIVLSFRVLLVHFDFSYFCTYRCLENK